MSKGSSALPLFGFFIGVVFVFMLINIATPEAVDDPGLATVTAENGQTVHNLGSLAVQILWVLGLLGFFKLVVIDVVFNGFFSKS